MTRFVLPCLLLAALPGRARCGEDASTIIAPPSIAVLPLVNFSGDGTAVEVFTPLIAQELSRQGIDVSDPGLTRETLRRYRIRAVGSIDREGADAITRELGVGYLLTGSIDLFVTGDVPEVGVSLRVVDAMTLQVVWARSTGAASTDYGTVFGLGTVTTVHELAQRVTEEALQGLNGDLDQNFAWELPLADDSPRLAVVTFDDLEPASHGGRVVSAHLLSQLVKRGYFVVEPGVANEFYLTYERIPRGGIDYELLGVLRDSLQIAAVVTGMVEPFDLGSPNAVESYPEIGISGRIINATTGQIRRSADIARDGSHEIVFGLGCTRSGAKLIRAACGALLDKLQLKENSSVVLR